MVSAQLGSNIEASGVVTLTFRNLVMGMLDRDTEDFGSIYVKVAGTFIERALRLTNGNLRRTALAMGTTHSPLSAF